PFDTLMTTQALRFYAIGLFAYSCVKIIVPVFYALNDTRWPVLTSFLAVAMNIVIVVSTLSTLQHRAIALSTSVTMISNFFILALVLYRKIGGFPVLPLLREVAKMALASLLMGLVVAGLSTLVHTPSSLIGRAAVTLGLIGVGGLAYVITGFILKIKALKGLTERTFRKNVA
ncbi:MAG TPA: murein biosynthesis integral membrane protein MurJ, partial [Dissulfuribacter thermophilus]|nr:murein biosynthesis integral membrane protein MurJ [Dissulfuribacter thermophilus]